MAYEPGALDATLSAAAGHDEDLFVELRQAFAESAERQLDLLRRSRCDANWRLAALRLKGLAASFNAEPLLLLAEEAADAAPGDPVPLRRIAAFLADFARD